VHFSKTNTDKLKTRYDDLLAEIKRFPFEDFPDYVKNLREYRWKPIIVALELRLHPSILWMDTSTVHKRPLDPLLEHFKNCSNPDQCAYYPWMLFNNAGHSIFAATHERYIMFYYIYDKHLWIKNFRLVNMQFFLNVTQALVLDLTKFFMSIRTK